MTPAFPTFVSHIMTPTFPIFHLQIDSIHHLILLFLFYVFVKGLMCLCELDLSEVDI